MRQGTVVILLSDKRSGSTLLERELCSLPGVAHVDYTPHSYNETHYWVKAACLLDAPSRLFARERWPKSYGSKKDLRNSLEKFLIRNVPEFVVPAGDEELIFEGWDALCEHFAAPFFFEKSPQHPHHWAALELMLQWAEQTTKSVKFVCLVRNPMSVMYSAQELFRTNPWERQYSWFEAYRNLLLFRELLGEGMFLVSRYEDLVSDPASEFKKICDFAGISFDGASATAAHKKSLQKWQQDREFQLVLDDSVARLARYFGYSDDDLFNPNGNEQVRGGSLIPWLGTKVHLMKGMAYDSYRRYFK